MPEVRRDGTRLHYERDGEGAEAVVFLQELGYGRWTWRWQREAVVGAGYDVVAPDARGTGRSEDGLPGALKRLPGRLRAPVLRRVAGYSVAGLAADLEAVLDDAGVDRAHLVGAGLGGMVAQEYALEYDRTASAALVGTTHGGVDAVDDRIDEALVSRPDAPNERERRREGVRRVFGERFVARNPHLLDRAVEWHLESGADDPARAALGAAAAAFDSSGRLGEIRVPTLVVHGSADRVVPVANGRLLAEKVPDARLEEVDGGSHFAFVEDDDRVSAALLSFLADHVENGRGTEGDGIDAERGTDEAKNETNDPEIGPDGADATG